MAKFGGIIMYEITQCYQGKSSSGKDYVRVSYFDVDTGAAGNVVVSPAYLEKITRGISEGKTLREGYDKKSKKTFIYVK